MYCPKCGKENPDSAQLCGSCSWVLASISAVATNPDAETSGLAITALVLAILSFLTFYLTMIPAIILGIVALVKIEKSAGRLKGKGLAIAGIAAPTAALPVFFLLLGIMMPALARVRTMSYRMVCGANMSRLGKAMLIYAIDNDGMYPTASEWCDLLIEYADVDESMFRCKGAPEGPCNYAMNKNIENLDATALGDTVVLFETSAGWNQSGGPEILTTENHKVEGCNVLFNDGHVEFIEAEYINDLKWTAGENE